MFFFCNGVPFSLPSFLNCLMVKHRVKTYLILAFFVFFCNAPAPPFFFLIVSPCYSSSSSEIAVDKDVRSAGEHSCQICFENDHSTAMLPCGHGGVCWDCGLQMYALTQECPMCRVKIEVVSASNQSVSVCNPNYQYRYAVPIISIGVQSQSSVSICNPNYQYR